MRPKHRAVLWVHPSEFKELLRDYYGPMYMLHAPSGFRIEYTVYRLAWRHRGARLFAYISCSSMVERSVVQRWEAIDAYAARGKFPLTSVA